MLDRRPSKDVQRKAFCGSQTSGIHSWTLRQGMSSSNFDCSVDILLRDTLELASPSSLNVLEIYVTKRQIFTGLKKDVV